jgi:hypothetical protein
MRNGGNSHLEDLVIDERLILRLVLNRLGDYGLNLYESEEGLWWTLVNKAKN